MNRSGMGVGSTLALLVFGVLCLAILALISLSAASDNKALADAAALNVKGYYTADCLAEQILAEILESEEIPKSVRGVDIFTDRDGDMRYLRFACPISDRKELYVEAVLLGDFCEILKWMTRDTGIWEPDGGFPVWTGE